MKRIISFMSVFAFMLAFMPQAKASHVVGGDIQYQCMGPGATPGSQVYRVRVRKYRDSRATATGGFAGTIPINVSSSCSTSFTINIPLVNGAPAPNGPSAPNLDQCVSTSSPDYFDIEEYIYEGDITLNTACIDWVFANSTNARNNAITTIVGTPSYYIEATLNSLDAPCNNSPNFVSTPVRVFCLNKSLSIAQTTTEADGDSIRYTLVTPKTSATNTVNFIAPFTATSPLSSSTPFSIDAKNGLINFTPSMIEVGVMAVLVEEYRFDSINNAWVNIGSALRDMQVNIAGLCKSEVFDGPQLDPAATGAGVDPITGHPFMTFNCVDSTVVLRFSNDIVCSSVDPTGADMRLTHPNGTPVPVLGLNPQNCNVDGTTRELRLKLHVPLSSNGDYILYTKVGFDGNTLTNACGFGVSENDTILLRVSGCFGAEQKIENVTIVDDTYPMVEFTPDLTSFPNNLLDEYRFYRSRNNINGPFNVVGSKTVATDIDFEDFSLGTFNVNNSQYFYYLSMVLNGFEDVATITDTIGSILLTATENGDVIDLFWSDYNGWGKGVPVSYEVFTTTDTSNGGNWQLAIAGLSDNQYKLTKASEAGTYWISVRTTNPNNNNYTSVSNWVDFYVPEPPVATPVIVPNVISPNSIDPEHVKFTITNLDEYSERKLVIYNRWGNKVYENTNYTNEEAWDGVAQNTGDLVGDGVYFYELTLIDAATSETSVHKGNVHVFTLGNQ